jgi:transcriptional regulator with XRE-family HTH domain
VTRLRDLRVSEGWSQARLVAAILATGKALGTDLPGRGSLITNLSRWENGHVTPGPEYRRILRHIFASTDEDLGFGDIAEVSPGVVLAPSVLSVSADLIAYFSSLFAQHIQADNLLGPEYVAPLVDQQGQMLLSLARQTRGSARSDVVTMAARYQEFLGWLHQDAGRVDSAMRHTDLARDLALELGDCAWDAYLLMRKSNIALDAGDAPQALALADAALGAGSLDAPAVRAVILRQKANSHAALREADDCESAIDGAFAALDKPTSDGGESLAPYCTREYVAMEAGKCWVQLGEPARALAVFDSTSAETSVASRRDQGLALARWAGAYAAADDVHGACGIAERAVGAAEATRSARIMRELGIVRRALRKWPRDERAVAVVRSIGTLVGET